MWPYQAEWVRCREYSRYIQDYCRPCAILLFCHVNNFTNFSMKSCIDIGFSISGNFICILFFHKHVMFLTWADMWLILVDKVTYCKRHAYIPHQFLHESKFQMDSIWYTLCMVSFIQVDDQRTSQLKMCSWAYVLLSGKASLFQDAYQTTYFDSLYLMTCYRMLRSHSESLSFKTSWEDYITIWWGILSVITKIGKRFWHSHLVHVHSTSAHRSLNYNDCQNISQFKRCILDKTLSLNIT